MRYKIKIKNFIKIKKLLIFLVYTNNFKITTKNGVTVTII